MVSMADRVERVLRAVKEAPLISYDTETSGVDWQKNSVVGYVIGVHEFCDYIPIRHGGGGNLIDSTGETRPLNAVDMKVDRPHPFELELAKAFDIRKASGPKLKTVGHNLKFDCHMSANHGIYLGRHLGDTQHRAALLNEFSYGGYSLEASALDAGVTPKKNDRIYQVLAEKFGGAADKKQMANFWRMDGNNPDVVDYASGDGITTIELWLAQQEKITLEELDVVDQLENDLIWTVFKMERRGMKVDTDRLEEIHQYVREEIARAKAALPSGYNAASNPQTRKIMEEAGHTDWPLTPSGNPSFPEKWLKTNPLGKLIVARRKMETLESRYIKPIKEHHLFNGRVHATLHQLKGDEFGTISGRFACSDPNLQAVHKRDKELGRLFRSAYVADSGYFFYEGDYSQCEPRLFAHYSDDENLVRGYNAVPFVDAHQVVADLLQVERDPTAKRMNMGIFTGMYPKTFAGHMGWDLERATAAWNKWMDTFPGIREFQNGAKATIQARGYIKTLLGRRCRLKDRHEAYKATSRIIQGGNADILKYKLLEADWFCESVGEDKIHLLMTIHDSFDWQAVEGSEGDMLSEEMVAMLSNVQCPPFDLTVPFVVDWKKGKNWAIATYGEKKDG